MQTDDSLDGRPCDNISNKNDTYCELTVLYWAWKNIRKIYPNLQYIGLMHYRRYFAFDAINPFKPVIMTPEKDITNYKADISRITRILSSGRVILSDRNVFHAPVWSHYSDCHCSDEYRITRGIIAESFPEYYDDFIDF